MRAVAIVLGSVASLGVWPSAPRPAAACGNPGPPTDRVSFAVVRREGVFAVAGLGLLASDSSIEVTGPDGAVVPGDSERLDDRTVWRGRAPLDPGARYQAAVFYVASATGETAFLEDFELVVSDHATPGLAPIELDVAFATEVADGRELLCCDEPISSCDRPRCWAQSWAYPVDVEVAWRIPDDVAADLVVYTVTAPDGVQVTRPPSPRLVRTRNTAAIRFPRAAPRYCVTVTAHHLLHGTTQSAELCADHRFDAPRLPPEEPEAALCDGNIVDLATGDVVIARTPEPAPPLPDDTVGAAGCSAGRASSAGAAALLLAASAALRRRGARRSRR